jgi:hypothetical protein
VTNPVLVAELLRLVSTFFGDRRRRKLRSLLRWIDRLLCARSATKSADDLLDVAATTPGSRLALLDSEGKAIASLSREETLALDDLSDLLGEGAALLKDDDD